MTVFIVLCLAVVLAIALVWRRSLADAYDRGYEDGRFDESIHGHRKQWQDGYQTGLDHRQRLDNRTTIE